MAPGAVRFIFGHTAIKPYQILYVIVIVVGATVDLELVWDIADTLNGLMALPNLIALALLSGVGGEVHQGVFHQGNFLRGSRVTAQVSKRTHRGSQTKKGRHDRGSCLPFWRGRLKSIFGIDRTVAEESPNRPFDRRRFCAVQAFSRKRKPWRRANSLCTSIQIPKGEAGPLACGIQKERHDVSRVFLFGTGSGARTHRLLHRNLNPARLPIPPCPQR